MAALTARDILSDMWWIGALALGVSLVLTPVVRLIAYRAKIVDRPDDLRRRRDRVCSLASGIRLALGYDCESIETGIPIIPIMIGSDVDAIGASQRMRELGMFVPAIRPPTVPEGQARLRISVSAGHSDDMIHRLVEVLRSF